MSTIIFDRDMEVGQWVASRIPDVQTIERFGDFTAYAFASDDLTEIYAGVVYHNYRDHDIELVMAADDPRWATKGNIRAVFAYPFIQLGVARVTSICTKRNKRVRKLLEGVGFKREGVARRAIDGIQDAVIYGMLRSEANRWLGVKNGQKVRAESTGTG